MDFWKQLSRKGKPVDIRISPGNIYDNITQQLLTHDIKFKIQIADLHSFIDEQNGESNRGRGPHAWFDKYHPLEEVGIQQETTGCLNSGQFVDQSHVDS